MSDVDSKVVSLKFDNSDFEQNVDKSINSLDKLNKSIDFSNHQKGGKGLEALSQTIKSSDLSGMEKNVGLIADRFSNLGIVGVTALQNITNKAVDAGEKLVKSLTIDPVKSGFNEYELKMNSMRTILASTRNEFDNESQAIEVVNQKLNELNKYSDETIYSFSDMTNNIGKFTNAGVDLNTAVQAIKGISNEAAISGANANEASRAMYNFSQALSAGYVKLIDWKSIENANMATKEFKEQLIETAVATGDLTKKGDMYITQSGTAITATQNFNDSLKDGWMTTEVLTTTLNNYATDVSKMTDEEKKAYEAKLKSIGYTDKQIAKIEETGTKAQAAASEINTWSKLVDTLQEAAQSGWAQTFEILFGDLKEATVLWTALGNGISNAISVMSDARNNMLQGWKDAGGRVALINGLANTVKYLGTLLKPIGKAFREIFPPSTGVGLAAATLRFEAFTKTLKASKDTIKNIKDTFKGLFSVIGLVKDVIFGVIKVLIPASRSAGSFGAAIFSITGAIGRFLSSGVEFIKKSGFITRTFEILAAVARIVVSAISKVTEKFVHFVTSVTSFGNKGFSRGLDAMSRLGEVLRKILSVAGEKVSNVFSKRVIPAFEKFGQNCEKSKKKVTTFIKENDKLSKTTNVLSSAFDKARKDASSFGEKTSKAFKDSGAPKALMVLKTRFEAVAKSAKGSFKNALTKLKIPITMLRIALKDLGGTIGGVLSDQVHRFVSFVKSLHIIDHIAAGIENLSARIEAFAGRIGFASRPVESFRKSLTGVGFIAFAKGTDKANKKLEETEKKTSFLDKIKERFEKFKSYLNEKGVIKALIEFKEYFQEIFSNGIDKNIDRATGITKIIAMLNMVSQSSRVSSGIVGVTKSLSGAIRAMGKVFGSIDKFVRQSTKTMKNLGGLLKTMRTSMRLKMLQTLGIAVALIAGSLLIISKIPVNKLKTSIAILGGILASLIATILILTKKDIDDKKLIGLAASFAALGASLLMITMSAKILAGMKPSGLLKSAIALAAFIGILVGAGLLASKEKKSLVGLLAISAAVALLVPTVLLMSKMSFETMLNGGAAIFSFVVLMGLAGRAASKDKRGMASFIGIATAIVALVPAILILSALPLDKALKSVGILSLLMLSLGASVRIATSMGGKGAATVAAMGAVVIALTTALMALALVPFGKLLKSVLALGTVMVAFSYAIKSMGELKAASVLVIVGLITMISGLVYMIASMNAESAVRALMPIGVFIAGLAVTISLLSKVGKNAANALPGLAVIGIVMAVLESLFIAFAALDDYLGDDTVTKTLKKAAEIGPLIGKAIGGFAGALVGSFTAEALAGVGKGLSRFMKAIKPFLKGAREIDSDVAEGVKNLAAAVLYLTGANLLDKINNFFSDEDDSLAPLEKFAKDLGKFTKTYIKMAKKAGELNDDQLKAGSKMAETLKDFAIAAQEIPPVGGLSKKIFGQKDLQSFADKVSYFAETTQNIAATKFAKGWKSKLQSIAEVITDLGEANQEIPENTISLKSIITGMKDLGKFGDQLSEFAPKLREVVGELGGDNPITAKKLKPVVATADAIKEMAVAADKIPTEIDEDSISAKITGVKNLPDFADGMVKMGEKIPDLIKASKGMNAKASKRISLMADVIKRMAEAANTIHKLPGNEKSARTGEQTNAMINSLAGFTANLSRKGGFVSKFNAFAKAAGNITASDLGAADKVSSSIKKMSGTAKSLSGIKGNAADTLISLATGLKTYANKVNDLSVDNLETNTEALQSSIKATTKALSGSDKKFKNSASSSIKSYTNSLNSGASKQSAGNAASSVRKAASDALSKTSAFGKAGKNCAESYTKGLKQTGSAKSAGSSLGRAAKDAAGKVSFYGAGKDGSIGFANGLKDTDAINRLTGAGTYIGGVALKAAEKKIKRGSPAKEFIAIGRDGTLGMAIGLLDYADKVYHAGEKIGLAGLNGATDAMSDLDMALTDPRITPVIDLSNVKRGASEINSMLANSAYVNGEFINGAINRQNGDKTAEVVSQLGDILKQSNGNDKPREIYNIGDVSLDVSNLDDVVKLGDFVNMLKQAKAIS